MTLEKRSSIESRSGTYYPYECPEIEHAEKDLCSHLFQQKMCT